MKDLKRIFQCLLPYRKPFILAVLFVVVETSFELIIPMIMADIIDVGNMRLLPQMALPMNCGSGNFQRFRNTLSQILTISRHLR